MGASPFDPGNDAAYAAWRRAKLDQAPRSLGELVVEVDDPRALSVAERRELLTRCERANMAIYASARIEDDREIPRRLGLQLGLMTLDGNYLSDEDDISPLTVSAAGTRRDFIPYTDRAIGWHTDGYYNPPEHSVRGMILHCVRAAARGGESRLFDHELAYLMLRDSDPAFVAALSAADAMTIPARTENDVEARPDCSGPVFSVDAHGFLHMRYTARTRSIAWKNDALVREALACLTGILDGAAPWILTGRLEPGMGLVCNNVLHGRSAFADNPDKPRLLYRARYYERISPVRSG